MKINNLVATLLACSLAAACGSGTTGKYKIGEEARLENGLDSLSWVYGVNFANTLNMGIFDSLDRTTVVQAICHTLEGKTQPMSEEAMAEAMNYLIFLQNASQMRQAKQQSASVDALQKEYLDELKRTNPNVKEHSAGFFYEELRPGHGPKAKFAQRICFDYRSKLMLTGEDFDQSYGNRDSIIHVVGKPMFPGLIEAFQLMNEGSIYRFYFPYQLAFGERGGGSVPGFTPLIYDIELHQLLEN